MFILVVNCKVGLISVYTLLNWVLYAESMDLGNVTVDNGGNINDYFYIKYRYLWVIWYVDFVSRVNGLFLL